jgi:hypothetical protein
MGQSLSRAVVHIIFSTKNRFAFLTDSERQKRMHGYHARIFNEHDSLSIDERHLGNRSFIYVFFVFLQDKSSSHILAKELRECNIPKT